MFKRLFWLTLGFGSGLGTSWYVVRSVKKTVRRTVAAYAPAEFATRAGEGMRDVRVSLRAAIAEGRAAMHERETELRARVEANRLGAATHAAPTADPTAAPTTGPTTPTPPGPALDAAPEAAPGPAAAAASVLDELAARRNRLVARAAGHARSGQ